MKNFLIAAGVLILVVAAFLVFNSISGPDQLDAPDSVDTDTSQDQSSNNAAENNQPAETPEQSDQAEPDTTIVYTDSGFTPRDYTVKAGGTVSVVNQSGQVLQFSSDDHPVHTDNPELNLAQLNPGESGQFQPSRTGTWGFHNHERDSHTGSLTVE